MPYSSRAGTSSVSTCVLRRLYSFWALTKRSKPRVLAVHSACEVWKPLKLECPT